MTRRRIRCGACEAAKRGVSQLVYADDWGHFPGDRGYSLGDQQPLLDR